MQINSHHQDQTQIYNWMRTSRCYSILIFLWVLDRSAWMKNYIFIFRVRFFTVDTSCFRRWCNILKINRTGGGNQWLKIQKFVFLFVWALDNKIQFRKNIYQLLFLYLLTQNILQCVYEGHSELFFLSFYWCVSQIYCANRVGIKTGLYRNLRHFELRSAYELSAFELSAVELSAGLN